MFTQNGANNFACEENNYPETEYSGYGGMVNFREGRDKSKINYSNPGLMAEQDEAMMSQRRVFGQVNDGRLNKFGQAN